MGTNFYTGDGGHVGKRSAAGLYCWNCDVTLCVNGVSGVHDGISDWYKCCPICGLRPEKGGHNPAMVELGFKQAAVERPTGVQGCSSFRWALDKEYVKKICDRFADAPVIRDEYGREMTGWEFWSMVYANCPIQHFDSIGRDFC